MLRPIPRGAVTAPLLLAAPALAPVAGPWPFAGAFRGRRTVGDLTLTWVGRIGASAGPEVGFRAARRVGKALAEAAVSEDRRRALADAWLALDALAAPVLGPDGGADLVLLFVAADPEGAALSAVGLSGLWSGAPEARLEPWIVGSHPLLGPPGRPGARRGALAVEALPPFIFASAHDGVDLAGLRHEEALVRCAVRA